MHICEHICILAFVGVCACKQIYLPSNIMKGLPYYTCSSCKETEAQRSWLRARSLTLALHSRAQTPRCYLTQFLSVVLSHPLLTPQPRMDLGILLRETYAFLKRKLGCSLAVACLWPLPHPLFLSPALSSGDTFLLASPWWPRLLLAKSSTRPREELWPSLWGWWGCLFS